MNEREKKEFYIAMCRCCFIAEAMKTCPACRFEVGLSQREKLVGAMSIPLPRLETRSLTEMPPVLAPLTCREVLG